ncbi:MAG TPA: hypothetical protein VES64_09475 [Allosphingosinicella sp.]|nr:hypothetical protein [Allosphingosinicella sp.]
MDEHERPVEVERETTVINTGGGGGGGGGTIVAVVVLLVLVVLAFVYFGGYLGRAVDNTDINVNVDAPKIELPDVSIETPPARQEAPAEPAGTNAQ